MLFNSFGFVFLFLPLVVAVYWGLLRLGWPRGAILWLGAASFFFYAFGERSLFWVALLSMGVNFSAGLVIAPLVGARRKAAFVAAIAFNLVLLGYFKYSNFLVEQAQALNLVAGSTWHVALPLGISFYTFTQIAFIADVYQRKAVERRPAPYFLFVTFFPHLIAGPILHHKEMMPQFVRPSRSRVALRLYSGLAMLALGLAKKLFLADPMGQLASGVSGPTPVGFFVAWLGAIAYALQIYFDFSGYSDMALGTAQMLGIKLPVNFNSPYKATNLVEFWRRWHISLSRFLRDYLYFPLGGNRLGTRRRYVNLVITMVLGGMWHGAGWTFLLWGALHGLCLGLVHAWQQASARVGWQVPATLGWALTLAFVIIAWVPFRSEGIAATQMMWSSMAGLNGFGIPDLGPLRPLVAALHLSSEAIEFNVAALGVMLAATAIALWAPNSQQLLRKFRVGLDSPGYGALGRRTRWSLDTGWRSTLAIAVLLGLSLRSIGAYSEFIYFRF